MVSKQGWLLSITEEVVWNSFSPSLLLSHSLSLSVSHNLSILYIISKQGWCTDSLEKRLLRKINMTSKYTGVAPLTEESFWYSLPDRGTTRTGGIVLGGNQAQLEILKHQPAWPDPTSKPMLSNPIPNPTIILHVRAKFRLTGSASSSKLICTSF